MNSLKIKPDKFVALGKDSIQQAVKDIEKEQNTWCLFWSVILLVAIVVIGVL